MMVMLMGERGEATREKEELPGLRYIEVYLSLHPAFQVDWIRLTWWIGMAWHGMVLWWYGSTVVVV